MKLCSAPCAQIIEQETYRGDVRIAEEYFIGHRRGILDRVESQMQEASNNLRFEEAALLRDRLKDLQKLSIDGVSLAAGSAGVDSNVLQLPNKH